MYNAPILKKALHVITLIAKQNVPLSVTEVARALGISKSTTFGILKSLEEEGFLFKDEKTKKYTTGSTLFELSKTILRSADVVVAARPYLDELMTKVDETVCLGVREEDKVKVVDVLSPKKEFKVSTHVGTEFAVTAGVHGKTFLSVLNDNEARRLLSELGLRRYTENSICDVEAFLRELDKTRKLGYATDLEEYLRGVRAIGALVHAGHLPVAVIWIMGLTHSMSDEKLPAMISHLQDTVVRINAHLSPSFTR